MQVAVPKKKSLGLTLPTEPSIPSENLIDYTWLIYGEKKIGKTSLVAQFPNTLFLMFEPGGKSLSTYQRFCSTWDEFLGYIELLESTPAHGFKTICIDTANLAYDSCLQYVCRKAMIEHPSDEGYGKGWNKVKQEFFDAHKRIAALGVGFVAIAHANLDVKETRSGASFHTIEPDLTKQAAGFYAGVVDVIGYYHYVGNERFLQIAGDDFAQAGSRCTDNFKKPNGERITKIPMGKDAKEAYNNLVAAFNNNLTIELKEVVKKLPVRVVR